MQKYFIKYQEHNAVGIKTHELKGSSWTQSIFDVGDLVAAFQQLPNSPLSDTFISELTLHLPEGVDKSSLSADGFADSNKTDIDVNPFDPKGVEQNALADDCFSTNSSLRPGLKISQLAGINSDDLHPFIIHKKGIQFYFLNSTIATFSRFGKRFGYY